MIFEDPLITDSVTKMTIFQDVTISETTCSNLNSFQDNTMNYVNLKGLAIGNGIISAVEQINSAPQLLYYRGILGKRSAAYIEEFFLVRV